MGQKVSPHGLRVGVIKDWDSKWYADKNKFADYLVEDNKVRDFVKKKLYVAGVSKDRPGKSSRKQTESDRSDSKTWYGDRKIRSRNRRSESRTRKDDRQRRSSSTSKK